MEDQLDNNTALLAQLYKRLGGIPLGSLDHTNQRRELLPSGTITLHDTKQQDDQKMCVMRRDASRRAGLGKLCTIRTQLHVKGLVAVCKQGT